MKICYARLRSNVNYVEPLEYIMDSYFELQRDYYNRHKTDTNVEFSFYNMGFNFKPKRDLDAISGADYIVIPSEAEFQYHIPGFIHTLDKKRSDETVKLVYSNIKPTAKIIILQSDHKDNPDLYKKYTFPGIQNEIVAIQEDHFTGSVAAMRYYFIEEYLETCLDSSIIKEHDFCYFGTDKSKDVGGGKSFDERKDVIKKLRKDENISSFYIGRFSGLEMDMKFTKKMKDLLPYLFASRSTLCFNWPDQKKTPTARYSEAIACRMIPFVWKDYDEDNRVVSFDWQRCRSVEEATKKIKEISNTEMYEKKYNEIREDYIKNKIRPKTEYYDMFENLMAKHIKI
jgi:hypothetical protein